mmetsp:Transcript_28049/g.24760  ORF Transcript_28049/g.24760 Transcript_28049/m.24760 type:complete len:165 (+) Transcript_28049:379-873(+)
MKIIPKYHSINKFELYYLGHFHAICPSYKISDLFVHVNNINCLVKEDLIDEETQVDFLLKILNKKIAANRDKDVKILNIPADPKSPMYIRGDNRSDTTGFDGYQSTNFGDHIDRLQNETPDYTIGQRTPEPNFSTNPKDFYSTNQPSLSSQKNNNTFSERIEAV